MAERDFEEFLGLLNKHRVRYCVIGAYAVAFHVRPRYTKDMDILVEPSLENGRKVVAALKDFGFGSLQIEPKDFTRPGRWIQLGYEPVRVDLLTSIEGCTFEQIWRNRARGKYGEQWTWFIGRDELIRNKTLTGRRQDRADLELLHPTRTPHGRRRTRLTAEAAKLNPNEERRLAEENFSVKMKQSRPHKNA